MAGRRKRAPGDSKQKSMRMQREEHARKLQDTWMEHDRVGVQDVVMLENFKSEEAFLTNLRQRFDAGLIYTYIGNVCVSVNPYKDLGIYTDEHVELYRSRSLFEMPPHVYAISDQAYRCMRDELLDQCVLISGESGAGKTEASKKILQFLAITATDTGKASHVRDRLLQCNPILEAFGNAKTIRNDNSSRFGKYMEVQFDFKGEPLGGRIINYLLEKCRVAVQMPGERNFHIFYMLLQSGDNARLQRYGLVGQADAYHYTRQGKSSSVKTIDDASDYREVVSAFEAMGFSQSELDNLLAVVAVVLQLGQLEFEDQGMVESRLKNMDVAEKVARLLGVDADQVANSLTHHTVVARGQHIHGNLDKERALYARDAIAKAVYDRMFTWLVERINTSLVAGHVEGRMTVMGLLDIYGFEIMQTNSFEQFCINYCNEKLQQVFIELTLKSEQEEYRNEGIQWEPVEYFNNKIICDMVEQKHRGIIAILDEECLRPGEKSDATFLEHLDQNFARHKHYKSHGTADYKERKEMGRRDFMIVHYAGTVTYTIDGFLDKNNDLLFRDLKELMGHSSNEILSTCFPSEELESKKRPITAGTQFKTSLNALIDILMAKTPSYVRCIKPNHNKRAQEFDLELVRHQVKYLGLMENLRVRRAGFAYRRKYEDVLERFKCLSKNTWPHFKGSARDGCERICVDLNFGPDDYRLGHTKLFIRHPRTINDLEERLVRQRHVLASGIQARYKGYKGRQRFLLMKSAVVMIAKHWRGVLARKEAERLKKAYAVIQKFIRGYKNRYKPRCPDNAQFLDYVRSQWLLNLRDHLPRSVLDRTWIRKTPPYLEQTSQLLRRMHKLHQAKVYRESLSKPMTAQLAQKVAASELFNTKKQNYPNSIASFFIEDRYGSQLKQAFDSHANYANLQKALEKFPEDQGKKIKYVAMVTKFDRTTYKARQRIFCTLPTAVYILVPETLKLNARIPFEMIKSLSVSNLFDGIFVMHTQCQDPKDKGDWIFHNPYVIEHVTKLALAARKMREVKVGEQIVHMRHHRSTITQSSILFHVGEELSMVRNKDKQLVVHAPALPVPDHYLRYKKRASSGYSSSNSNGYSQQKQNSRGDPFAGNGQRAAQSNGRGRGAARGGGGGQQQQQQQQQRAQQQRAQQQQAQQQRGRGGAAIRGGGGSGRGSRGSYDLKTPAGTQMPANARGRGRGGIARGAPRGGARGRGRAVPRGVAGPGGAAPPPGQRVVMNSSDDANC